VSEGPLSESIPLLRERFSTALLNPAQWGRTWWAHFEFTRINIEPIILRKKIEDLRQLAAFMCPGEPRSRTTRER